MDETVRKRAGRLSRADLTEQLFWGANATTLRRMKQRPGVRKAAHKSQRLAVPSDGTGQRQCVILSLALDEWAPPAEVENRILRRVLQAVAFKGAINPFE